MSGFSAGLRAARVALAAAALALLAACAGPITAKVTNFNVWPADAAGSTFSYQPHPEGALSELEQSTYEGYVRIELERLGLKPAAPGQVGRFLVDLTATGTSREKKVLEPVYGNPGLFVPPYRDTYGNVIPGYWRPDRFGTRYLGDREVSRTVQVNRVNLRLLDAQAGSPGKPRAVFESTAVYEGDNEDLPDLVPYLVRAVFDGFPGPSGRVRVLKFDARTGALVSR
ncbi:DUF4136 domain-containing protein [Variovorax terrae]|uniref:DUF4136 domain-containing protein n=1 Tax=Variovorax terrae TaxID=2923278 RepID=A0A9X1VSA7_9BURK|nr:DUF4136 domain-containing protein [Variovorax terrae]MCJ0762460.1 DUF4136 domain-containing protein [Variovorax terrae]